MLISKIAKATGQNSTINFATSSSSLFRLCIVGSGPAGFYTAKYLQKGLPNKLEVTFIDKAWLPHGLVRYGVAPDHLEVRNAAHEFDQLCPPKLQDPEIKSNTKFFGGVEVLFSEASAKPGVTLDTLRKNYDAVILAIGSQEAVRLDIEGHGLSGVTAAGDFTKWINGWTVDPSQTLASCPNWKNADKPNWDFNNSFFSKLNFLDLKTGNLSLPGSNLDGRNVVVIGNGNVALDVARILLKNPKELALHEDVEKALSSFNAKSVNIIGRRGLLESSFSPSELRELLHLPGVCPIVPWDVDLSLRQDSGRREKKIHKIFTEMQQNALNPHRQSDKTIIFLPYHRPMKYKPNKTDPYFVGEVEVELPNRMFKNIPADFVLESVGFRQPNALLDLSTPDGRALLNENGRVLQRGKEKCPVYAVGWCRAGPLGTIAATVSEAAVVAAVVLADLKTQ